MLKVLILSKNTIATFGLINVLQSFKNELIVNTACNSSKFLIKLKEVDYDLIILDYNPSHVDEWNMIRNVVKQYQTKIIIFAECINPIQINELYNLGIKGYVNMAAERNEIRKALAMILKGGRYLPQIDFIPPQRLMQVI